MADSTATMTDLTNLQNQAQQQYISESMNEVQQEMAAQQAQMAKAAAEAWAKAQ
jgi:hypothetical protein